MGVTCISNWVSTTAVSLEVLDLLPGSCRCEVWHPGHPYRGWETQIVAKAVDLGCAKGMEWESPAPWWGKSMSL